MLVPYTYFFPLYRYNLLAHMRTHEDQTKPNSNSKHQCPICFLHFQRRRKLDDHLKNAHNTIPNQNIATTVEVAPVQVPISIESNLSSIDCADVCSVKLEC